MNRFDAKKKIPNLIARFPIAIVLFALLLVLFLVGVNNIARSADDKQLESLENALNRNITHCYCVEGTYPPSLDYIVEHYGLTYDTDAFFVDYISNGSNMYPDVTILELK